MKKLAFVFFIGAGLIGTPAFAADMGVKAPPPAPAPVYNWTGWYVGGNAGFSFGIATAGVRYFAPTAGGSPTCGPAGHALCIGDSDNVQMNGPLGGFQAGYNWQNGPYLLGVEADFQGSGQSGTRNLAATFNNGNNFGGVTQGTAGISITERMPWFGTVRGRVGYVANQWLVVYATGGLAYGRIEIDSSASASGLCGGAPGICPVWDFSGSGVTRIGWTVGGGYEVALGGNWTAKFEYLFVDLGSFDTTFTGLPGTFGVVVGGGVSASNTAAGTGTIHSRIIDNIARVGLNYQFH